MIMIIAIIYNLIICDIWSTVENYFEKTFRSSWKNPLPFFFFTHSPLQIWTLQVPPFWQHIKYFSPPPPSPPPPCRKRGEDTEINLPKNKVFTENFCKITLTRLWQGSVTKKVYFADFSLSRNKGIERKAWQELVSWIFRCMLDWCCLYVPTTRLVFSWFFYTCGNLGNPKEKLTRKTYFSAKWSTWLYASTSQNFARQDFLDVNGVSIVISWERDVEMGENMWKVLKTKAWA